MYKWDFYTSREIRPDGWLKRQLEIQAQGLSGNLDKVWRDVRDSAWIGGDAEGWERVPYWLDGFIPLAYLLGDEDLIGRAKKYVDAILSYQKPSGWICPCTDEEIPTYDTWAVLLISKVLTVYYECSGDERIPEALYRVLKNYYELLKNKTVSIFEWGKYRWYEGFVAINFLLKKYSEPWLYELALILKDQGIDPPSLTDLWHTPKNVWTLDTHIVNIAMMLKYEAISCDVLGEEYVDRAEELVEVLKEYNGTPVGLFTGDECLSGLSAIQGTELCSVVEQMYSYEHLLAHTGERKWAERLQMLTFNALPATISDDMWVHQYVQMSNQIACKKLGNKPIFRTNGPEAHLFGLEPHFGCCTSNFNQGWPKFALSAFMHKDNRVLSAIFAPATLVTDSFTVALKTNYPFDNKLKYCISAKTDMELEVIVPSFARNLSVDGVHIPYSEKLSFKASAGEEKTIEIAFDTVPTLISRPHNLKSVQCGALIFSLPIEYEKKMYEYEKNGVLRKYPYCDYEYLPKSDWNYAYSSPFFELERRELSDVPFNSHRPPVVIKAQVKKIAWGFEDGYDSVCAKSPQNRAPISEAETVELYPYGCTKLRMTELPLI